MTETPDIESSSDEYAKRFSGETGKWMLEIQNFATNTLLKPSKNQTILDVGGGHGQNIELLLKKGFNITIFGSNEICGKRIQKYIDTTKINFITGDLLNLPFEDNQFDIVISYRMLTHISNWKQFISELSRVSKKTILIDFPSFRSANIIAESMFKYKKKVEKNTRTYKVFKEKDVIKEFKNFEFMPEKKFPQFFIPMAFHRLLKQRYISSFLETILRTLYITYFLGSPIIYKFEKKQ